VTIRALARSRALILVALAALSLAFAPRAHADTAPTPYIQWSSVLPGWNDQYAPGSDNDCAAGTSQCLGHTIREMLHIFTPNARSCSHLAVFPMAYVRMTQTYGWTRTQSGYYDDVPYMNHMDAVFAKYYTDSYDNWSGGNRAAVPQSWLYAFDAAQHKSVSGAGDLLLGMNAHINRDLPFVLYASGLVGTDGSSGKSDYDAVEKWLNDDTAPMFAEAAQRFDPTIDNTNNIVFNSVSFQMVSAWRENAWRNAEALASAPDATARALVAANIENYANSIGQLMLHSFAYSPLTGSTASRDAYCAVHHGDTAPMAYPMGTPSAWGNSIS
jgi:Family of unknown function (DUF5995)